MTRSAPEGSRNKAGAPSACPRARALASGAFRPDPSPRTGDCLETAARARVGPLLGPGPGPEMVRRGSAQDGGLSGSCGRPGSSLGPCHGGARARAQPEWSRPRRVAPLLVRTGRFAVPRAPLASPDEVLAGCRRLGAESISPRICSKAPARA